MIEQPEIHSIGPRDVAPLNITADDVSAYRDLRKLGICLDENDLRKMAIGPFGAGQSLGMDAAITPAMTGGGVTTPIQYLQRWLPGFVKVETAARKIDDLVGLVTQAKWEDKSIIQGVLEHVGEASPYGDYTNVPMSSWNVVYEERNIVRFEEGLRVGRLEEARATAILMNSADAKRIAAASALEIARNRVGFFGYNNGDNRTYGFLNDPALPAYVAVPAGGGATTEWTTKTFLEITADIRTALAALRVQSQDTIDPASTPVTLALPTSARETLTTTSSYGNSVNEWLKENYPNIRVISAPELDGANGGDNVFYMYAESAPGDSTDDGRTFTQVVPAKFQTLGVEQQAKAYIEDFTNATAGILTKRPYLVYRGTGI